MQKQTKTQLVDIAIIGAGAVGLAFALAASKAGFSVALLGTSPVKRDGRTVALLEGSWAMLEDLGVTKHLSGKASPLATMRLVDDTGSLFRQPPVSFQSAEMGLDAFGQNVETTALVAALAEVVAAETSILHDTQPAVAITICDDQATIMGAEHIMATARLVVGADGRNSLVRQAAGITGTSWNYPQVALTTILSHAREHRDTSTEFHTRSGPCTLVPLPGKRSSLVWMQSPEDGARHMAMDDAVLARAVETKTHSIMGAMTIDGPRGLVPMGGLSVSQFSGRGMALIGEAAHVFPPIGAQGLNLGLRDVAGLIRVISQARDAGQPFAATETLALYDQDRRGDVMMRTNAVDMLNRSLLADFLPVDLGRGIGMLAMAKIGPLRRMMMKQGLGLKKIA